jgi:hypothetical protein
MLLSSLDSHPHPEVRDWDKIKAFLADNASSALAHHPPLNQLRLFTTAILAAVLEPEKMRSKDPGPAIQRAAQLLDRLPEYLPFEALSAAQERVLISKRIDDDIRAMRHWKMDKGTRLTLEQFLETPDCQHKSLRELKAMLKRVGFPFLETPKRPSDFPVFLPAGQITLEAYQLAQKRNALLQQKRKLESQKKRRVKRV